MPCKLEVFDTIFVFLVPLFVFRDFLTVSFVPCRHVVLCDDGGVVADGVFAFFVIFFLLMRFIVDLSHRLLFSF